jgi:hypothetical protein
MTALYKSALVLGKRALCGFPGRNQSGIVKET